MMFKDNECEWNEMDGWYYTDCGEGYLKTEHKKELNYCVFCGKHIKIIPYMTFDISLWNTDRLSPTVRECMSYVSGK